MKRHHSVLYVAEFLVIAGGFALMLSLSLSLYLQLLTLLAILLLYIGIGLFHHNTHHDITAKVVLEYILISALVFALFVFLNISRI